MSHWTDGHPMTPARAKPMPRTIPHYKKMLAMDLHLIEKQLAEIGTLKNRVNRLEQKLRKARNSK